MKTSTSLAIASVLALTGAAQAQTVHSASGADAASILPTVDAYRAVLGALNGNNPGSVCSGRREINWDGVPNSASSPNAFPGNFFNGTVPGRARGIEFATPGTGFQVSANVASGAGIAFSNINPSFVNEFKAFSPERLFVPIGSGNTTITFFVPGTTDPATTRGFGVVFSDVEVAGSTTVEYFDVWNNSLGEFPAPAGPTADQSFSFVGVDFEDAIVARVEITSNGLVGGDLVVMDDFLYGEPVTNAACGLCPADLTTTAIPGSAGFGTPDGVLNNDDFFFFLAAFAQGNLAVADLTTGAVPAQPGYGLPNGVINNDDFYFYLTLFAAGC